ncbi:MAG: DUF4347 domain-containing protein [Nostoc sp. ChiSLP02]|nr:DUF4347 domain-containing protein [Nostoc sp. ChiSLP02]
MTASFKNPNNLLAGTTFNSVTTAEIEGNYIKPTPDLHAQMPANQLVFIDSQLENYQNLVAGVLPNMTVIVLDSERDGIEQISQVLALHGQLKSVHIVSHGAPGRIFLGNTQLSRETLNRYTWQLMGWANALAADAQLLVYGCEVAQTEQGIEFVRLLSELTGAVVAASDRLIGNWTLGTNWELNISTGAIASPLAFQQQTMAGYSSVMGKVYLDTTFNTTGQAITDFNGNNDGVTGMAVQSDGKVLVAGFTNNGSNNDFAIVRYNSDGTLDTTFNTTGKVITDFNGNNDFAYSISIQSDGKILVTGVTNNGSNDDFAIARYNSDGTLDTTFNTTGTVTTDFNGNDDGGNSITIQSDGKILVAGVSQNGFGIARYNSDGTLDTTFNTTGTVTNFVGNDDAANSIIVQSDGKILVAGVSFNGTDEDLAIVRYNSDGTLDTTFNTTGIVTTDINGKNDSGNSIAIQSDGKILVAGVSGDGINDDLAIVRYNSDGTLDTTFNTTGKVTTDFSGKNDSAANITVQPDGKILVTGVSNNGTTYDFAIARYNSDGTLDTTFNNTGKFTSDFNGNNDYGSGIFVQSDGKIVVAGDTNNVAGYDFAIGRYLVNQAPEVVNEIEDREATEDSVFNFTVPDDTFSDADAKDILTYTATLENDELLPTWLNFNPTTLTFSGTPTKDDVGSLNIKVTAKDVAGDEASDVFTLAVDEKNTDLSILPITLLTKITGDIFSVKTKLNIKGDKAKLSIKIKTKTAKQVDELCVFNVDDDEGKIDGIAPGAEGYAKAALLRSKVILASLGNLPNGFNITDLTNILEFDSDTKLRFYMVSNSTTEAVLSGKTSFSNVVFSSATDSSTESEGFSLNFQNLIVTVQATNQQVTLGTGLQGKQEGELIDLREVKQSVKADFKVFREAAFNNCIGFYEIADESGGIDTNDDGKADILVGDAGYAEAAVRMRITDIDLTVSNQGTGSSTGNFKADSLFAPFLIVNGKIDKFLDKNSNNDPKIYFAFLGANSDKTDHIRLLANNTFGIEDLANGGDQDFNDLVVQVNLKIA